MNDNYKTWRKISTPQYTEERLEAIYNVILQSRMRFQSKNWYTCMTFYKYTLLHFFTRLAWRWWTKVETCYQINWKFLSIIKVVLSVSKYYLAKYLENQKQHLELFFVQNTARPPTPPTHLTFTAVKSMCHIYIYIYIYLFIYIYMYLFTYLKSQWFNWFSKKMGQLPSISQN
jgi:hypothetical protein